MYNICLGICICIIILASFLVRRPDWQVDAFQVDSDRVIDQYNRCILNKLNTSRKARHVPSQRDSVTPSPSLDTSALESAFFFPNTTFSTVVFSDVPKPTVKQILPAPSSKKHARKQASVMTFPVRFARKRAAPPARSPQPAKLASTPSPICQLDSSRSCAAPLAPQSLPKIEPPRIPPLLSVPFVSIPTPPPFPNVKPTNTPAPVPKPLSLPPVKLIPPSKSLFTTFDFLSMNRKF